MALENKGRNIPGIERYAAFPHTEKAYRRHFREALNVLSYSTMTEDIRARATILAVAYASAKTELHFSLEEQMKLISLDILRVGDEIIAEKGWSSIPEENNFAWQLRGIDSMNAKSLRLSAQTGKTIDLVQQMVGSRRRGQIVRITEFTDVPDVVVGVSPEQPTGELMFDLFADLAKRLGFIAEEEDIRKSPRVKKPGSGYFKIVHPNQRFSAYFADNTKHNSRREFKFFPGTRIQINLYHQEKVRSKK